MANAETSRFRDRRDAGRRLVAKLQEYAGRPDVVVLALPRGGVPVGYEVADALNAPLDVLLVRKLGVPGHEELAMGAIASGGVRVLDDVLIAALELGEDAVAAVSADEQRELERRERLYRGGRPAPDVGGKLVLLVDDGLATGSTMRAAVQAVRALGPAEVVVAVPVAPPATCRELDREADVLVCALTPEPFTAVGVWYERFGQTEDDEIVELLESAAGRSDATLSDPTACSRRGGR
jgi:putative phosphoribosyl transferase